MIWQRCAQTLAPAVMATVAALYFSGCCVALAGEGKEVVVIDHHVVAAAAAAAARPHWALSSSGAAHLGAVDDPCTIDPVSAHGAD